MRRFLVSCGIVVASLALTVPTASALHGHGGYSSTSSGFPWETILLWSGIGVGIVVILVWMTIEARRHHWHMPHRQVHA